MEEKYVNIYKCRLCGEIFSTRLMDDDSYIRTYLEKMCHQSDGERLPYAHHVCKNGDIGFADILGFKKLEKWGDIENA